MKARTLEERFWAKVAVVGSSECWLWRGAMLPRGYGKISAGGKHGQTLTAHRVSYALHKGPVPQGLFVCHSCDTPACVNPAHLFIGTVADNVRDMDSKGRRRTASKLTFRQAAAIKRLRNEKKLPLKLIASRFGITFSNVSAIALGKSWRSA